MRALVVVLVAGCGDGAAGTAVGTGTGALETTGTSTGGPPTGTTAPTSSETGGTGTTSTGADVTASDITCGFLCDATGEPGPERCDVLGQDCPEGEKCAPYAGRFSSAWSSTKCVPVTGDGKPGEPCTTVDSAVSGLDDCEKGAMCWNVSVENEGVCIEMCSGSRHDPVCDDPANYYCASTSDGVLYLCIAYCDPLMPECAGDDVCIPYNDAFSCAPDASGTEGQAFDPCEYVNVCDPGLLCLPAASASECDPQVDGCCLPFCDLTDANTSCPGVGQSCVSYYGEEAPAKYASVGVCVIPG